MGMYTVYICDRCGVEVEDSAALCVDEFDTDDAIPWHRIAFAPIRSGTRIDYGTDVTVCPKCLFEVATTLYGSPPLTPAEARAAKNSQDSQVQEVASPPVT